MAYDDFTAAPHAHGVEQALLGMIINNEHIQAEGCSILSAACFYDQAHRTIFLALQQMQQKHLPITMVTSEHYLQAAGQLDEVGGLDYMSKLCIQYDDVPSYLRQYAGILRAEARRRGQLETSRLLASQATSPEADLDELTQEAVRQLTDPAWALAEEVGGDGFHLAELAAAKYRKAEELSASGRLFSGLDTGFSELNLFTNGLNRSEMTILAARPSIGKTTLALQIAHHVAHVEKVGVAIFSLEMSLPQIGSGLARIQSRVDPNRLRQGRLIPEDQESYFQALSDLSSLPIYAYQDNTIEAIQARMERLTREHPDIGLCVIDHLHRIQGSSDEYDRLNDAAWKSANMALSYDCSVLLLSQLSRSCEDRSDKRPQLSDLRACGGIEEHGVNVWMIYRPGFYDVLRRRFPDGSEDQKRLMRETQILVEKQRDGQVDGVPLAWNPEKALFCEKAPEWRNDEGERIEHYDNR